MKGLINFSLLNLVGKMHLEKVKRIIHIKYRNMKF